MRLPLLLLLLLLPLPAAAAPDLVNWAGSLFDEGVPVDGTVSAIFTVTGAGGVVETNNEPSLLVVDGVFVVTLLTAADDPPFTLGIAINGDELGAIPLVFEVERAVRVAEATRADVADNVEVLGNIDDVTAASNYIDGDVDIHFGNVDALAPFADGDFGIDFVPDALQFTQAGPSLRIADGGVSSTALDSVAAAKVATGAVATIDLADGSLGAAEFATASIPTTALSGITAANLSLAADRTVLFEVTDARCEEPLGLLTRNTTCRFISTTECTLVFGGNQVTGHRDCDNVCALGSTFDCPNTAAGSLVFN